MKEIDICKYFYMFLWKVIFLYNLNIITTSKQINDNFLIAYNFFYVGFKLGFKLGTYISIDYVSSAFLLFNPHLRIPYFSDYKMHSPQIWEENGSASYSPNAAYLARFGGGEWGVAERFFFFFFLFSTSKTLVRLMVWCAL